MNEEYKNRLNLVENEKKILHLENDQVKLELLNYSE